MQFDWKPAASVSTLLTLTLLTPALPGQVVEEAKLTASSEVYLGQFGTSLQLQGERMVVGAAGTAVAGVLGTGDVHVLVRDGSSWTEQAAMTMSPLDLAANLGSDVAIDGDTLVAGAFAADPLGVSNSGAAWVFRESGGAWSQEAMLSAQEPV